GGTTFDVAAVLTPFVSDADGVVEIGPARGFRRRLEGRVDALVACGPGIAARWPTTAFTGSISREAISSSAHARRCAP
ncbi:MAG TPA: hypothetical protein VMT47_17345, partial [Polyangia bacterium]|nr:hypothetical protein [Polyangia bacterium]